MNRTVLISFTILCLLSTVFLIGLSFNIQRVKASGTIYIRADGSVVPSTANITSADNMTYYFTDNNYDEIVVERSNIIVDGAGYTLQGTEVEESKGIDLTERKNVTVMNMQIKAFGYGIYLNLTSHSALLRNNITNNGWDGLGSFGLPITTLQKTA